MKKLFHAARKGYFDLNRKTMWGNETQSVENL